MSRETFSRRVSAMAVENRVAIITGATGFLGSEVCRAFLEAGATVVGVYVLDKELAFFEKTLGADAKRGGLEKADGTEDGEVGRVGGEGARDFRRGDCV